jgi:hypothetical protein
VKYGNTGGCGEEYLVRLSRKWRQILFDITNPAHVAAWRTSEAKQARDSHAFNNWTL